ncbi:MAG: serine hydrolase [Chryseolinea sp.]
MKEYLFSLALLILSFLGHAQKGDRALSSQLEQLTRSFNGTVGIYVKHLKTGRTVSINADSIFPTASMIKIPITIGIFNKIEQGALDYNAVLTYRDSLRYEGEDIIGSLKDSAQIALSKVIMLMITTSDNTGSLWCQSLAGSGTAINDWLQQNRYHYTRVNSRTPGREADRAKFGWGQTTPKEMAMLVQQIRDNKVISPRTSERIYRNLGRIYWDSEALSQIPPTVHTAAKQGAVDQSRSEVVLVNAPHGDYVFCVITKHQQDQSWTPDNEGYALIRNVSKILYNYFEPDSKWEPPADAKAWYH